MSPLNMQPILGGASFPADGACRESLVAVPRRPGMGSGGLPRLPGLHDPLEDDGKQSEEQFLHGSDPLIG
jgi:hypothetical protein